MSFARGPAEPALMVIFGGSGDLALRMLIPALYHLERRGLLPACFGAVGVARAGLSMEAYRDRIREKMTEMLRSEPDPDPSALERFLSRFFYYGMDVADAHAYSGLGTFLEELDRQLRTGGSRLFYLAVPPRFFSPIIENLGSAGLTREEGTSRRRVVIEKPFGRDYESARALNRVLERTLTERQIFRIDHYLGKETVQNIMVLRFANGIFEPIWNRNHIDSIQITVAETLGVEDRGNYYDQAGALRDMVPNHLFQLLSMIAMEPPNSFDAEDVRTEKYKALRAIQPFTHESVLTHAVRGQYEAGELAGARVAAYRAEPRVAHDSPTETFVAMKLLVENWRWAGVPFYLRTGKRLASRITEICISFKQAPGHLFRELQAEAVPPNQLVIQVQPEERISVNFGAKVPGPGVRVGDVSMDFCYRDFFRRMPSTGYETLIYDCLNGDMTLFQRGDHVEAAWSIISPIQDVWSALKPRDFPNYPAGSWGPEAARALLGRDGRQWRFMEGELRPVVFEEPGRLRLA